eukprot:CAMPEP_0172547498 /NCGR_PEP_ID=MMETSP1067-20121228/17016_1 /TAXON_ID=265564 ORGANISM="Thalassiosira punctigera, Strain Tpunct2005C2" /NCGR_SAMPLE_ID=MMETSP1067 /ASSEMBLY_ACC=CAM_ASM_000444 /LENGTH=404 /DNA_ID=CAMNT_0013334591 /DNA_START=240 /DNA_END=1452 /DNA_ORIENTATION=+
MSATSCAFVKFEHQYKSEGRYLLDFDNDATAGRDGGLERNLQTTNETDLAFGAAAAANLTEDTAATGPVASPTDDAATTDTAAAPDDGAVPVAAPAESAAETLSPQPTPGVFHQYQDELNGDQDIPMGGPMGGQAYEEDEMTDNAFSTEEDEFDSLPTGTTGTTETTGITGSSSDEGSPSAASEKTSALSGASQAAASASGDAGLYCDGEQSFLVTNLWGQSVQELAEELGTMSDQNESEELARGAAVAACTFGLVAAFVLILTTLIGWRMCCERWIIALAALCACVSQGVTFLFFNSERYCDGDIVHEILNQEPCVLGRGGLYSITALLLYALVMAMACRLPQDDPYGLCCKKRSTARNNESGSEIGSPDATQDNTARSGQERERPNWISEDAKGKEENEIIE